jgi:type I restriction enzyme S subunit
MPLGAVTTKIGSGATPLGGESSYKESGISLIRSLNVHDSGFRHKDLAFIDDVQAELLSNVNVESNDVLLNITGASVARCCTVPNSVLPARVNQHVSLLRPINEVIYSRFLHYLLISPQTKARLLRAGEAGSTRQALTKGLLQDFRIEFPTSLKEQERIVAVLDEAFDGIAMAISNAKQSLQNVNSLISSYFDSFLNGRKNWTALPIHMCFKVRSGDFLPAKQMDQTGSVPVYGGNGIAGYHTAPNLDGDNIIIGRVGAKCGNVRHVKGALWLTDNALYVSELLQPFDKEFLAIRLEAEDLRRTANQTAQPVISYSTIKNIVLSFPLEIHEQQSVVQSLNTISVAVESLRSSIEAKISALQELKRSLLYQAFSGNL